MSESRKLNIQVFSVASSEALEKIEKEYRRVERDNEALVLSRGTKFNELVTSVYPGKNANPYDGLKFIISNHTNVIGSKKLCTAAQDFLKEYQSNGTVDVIYISSGMDGDQLKLKLLLRTYEDKMPRFKDLFDSVGDDIYYTPPKAIEMHGNLVFPDEVKDFNLTDEMKTQHARDYNEQKKRYLDNATKERPFLNQLTHYIPKTIIVPEDKLPLIYDLKTRDQQIDIITSYKNFTNVFQDVMDYVHGVEYNNYYNTITPSVFEDIALGEIETGMLDPQQNFMKNVIEPYIRRKYVDKGLFPNEDIPAMMKKLHRALYELYILQDLIDDKNITDIKITGPDSIRVRIKGKTYLCNVNFINARDLRSFIHYIAIRNGISEYLPEQTFTDTSDANYILRFSLTASFVNSVPWPYLHIRKVDRQKPMDNELIKAGMFTPKIRDYLLDCGRNSRGIVFCGPPGSGKTVILNWFLEAAYEQSAEILVIQENDELFAYRKGVMFQHVVHYATDQHDAVTLEELGQLALVAGANVFIIGEAKGAEICSAITLSNSGCRTALTIHSNSAIEATDKMADLAMRGFGYRTPERIKKQLMSFQTQVFLKDFKVQEISEVIGYDEKKNDLRYRYIYRRDEEDVGDIGLAG